MTLKIYDKAPNFTMPTDNGGTASLTDFKGQNLVLYFYPRDNTPGCTTQACALTDHLSAFNDLNTAVVGVSKDSAAKHDKFKAKKNIGFPLASDEESDVCERYGVWAEKSMYGKKFMGIVRTTFLIDGNGVIQHIWHKVKVKNHVEDVIEVIQNHEG